jgi:hypothetical protein
MSPVACGLFYDAWKVSIQRPSDDPSSLWFGLRRMESFSPTSFRCPQFLVVCFTTHGKFFFNVLQMIPVPCGLVYDAWKVFLQRPSDDPSSLWFELRRMESFSSTSFKWPQFLVVCFTTPNPDSEMPWFSSAHVNQSLFLLTMQSNDEGIFCRRQSQGKCVSAPLLIFRGRPYMSVTRYLRRCASSGADVNICRRG